MRLKPGVTLERANSEMASVMAGLARGLPRLGSQSRLRDEAARRFRGRRSRAHPDHRDVGNRPAAPARVRQRDQPAARARRGACAGDGRPGRARRRPRAASSGSCSRSRHCCPRPVRCSVRSVAYAGVRALLTLGASRLPRLDEVTFDTRVLLFALATLVGERRPRRFRAGAAARGNRRANPHEREHPLDERRTGNSALAQRDDGRRDRLAIMLVAGAGWLVRGFANLRNTDLGFVADKRLLFDVSFLGAKYPNGDAVRAASRALMDRLAALPGVTGVGATANFPLRSALESSLLAQLHGEPFDSAHPIGTRQRFVSEGYFRTIGTTAPPGTRLRTGRSRQHDAGGDRQQDVRQAVPRGPRSTRPSVLGRLPRPDPRNEVTVIGVVDDVRQKSVSDEAGARLLFAADAAAPATSDDRRGHVGDRCGTAAVRDPRRSAAVRSADRRRVRAA